MDKFTNHARLSFFFHLFFYLETNILQCCQIHTFSREFTNFHTFSRNLFYYRFGRQTKLKIASHGLFHKKSFIFPIRGGITWIVLSTKDFLSKSP
jgi:hypothetical protein